jgi:chaperonin GroEL
MGKQILFDDEARRQLSNGVRKLGRAVRVTYGPSGRNVMLEKGLGKTVMTRDGLNVSREIEVEEPFHNMGAKLLNEVATRTNKDVGDGTTSAVILAEAIIEEGTRFLGAGVSPIALRTGIEKAVEAAVEGLKEHAIPVENRRMIEQVGTIASNEPELGKLFGEAMHKVGLQGVVTVEENDGVETMLDLVEGFEIDKGYLSPYFITDVNNLEVVLDDALIFVTDRKISSLSEILPVLEQIASSGKPLLIVAEDVEGEALSALIVNRLRGVLRVAAVKAPGFGDRRKAMLEDFSVMTGATFFAKDTGFDWNQVQLKDLGKARKVEVSKDKTLIFRGAGKKANLDARCEQLRSQIEQTSSNYDREKLEERLAKISGQIAVIRVGGHSEAEIKERKDRADDALAATRAAMEEGVVPGAGTGFVRAIPYVEEVKAKGDERFGVEVVARALRAPLVQLAENLGEDGHAICADVEEAEEWCEGYDGVKRKVTDLVKAGVIDALKVSRVALQNAASIASLYLTSDTAITEVAKKSDPVEGALS